MAAKRKANGQFAKSAGTTRRRVPAARKKRRTTSYLKRNPTKSMAGVGAGVGAFASIAPAAISAIKTRSAAPIVACISVPFAVAAAKNTAVGYVAGYATGAVVNKTKFLKKPINKLLKKMGSY